MLARRGIGFAVAFIRIAELSRRVLVSCTGGMVQ